MRSKFVFGLTLSALALLCAVFFLKQRMENTTPAQVAPAPAAAPNSNRQNVQASVPKVAPAPAAVSNVAASAARPSAPIAPVVAPALTDEARQAAIDAEVDRLQEWSRNNDPQSLSNILTDLTNSEKEVREAAIEATEQFGSSAAIPVLKAVAANTADTEEQIDLLDAADFLSLPTVNFTAPTPAQIQAARQQRAQIEAQRQARAPQPPNSPPTSQTGPNQSPSSASPSP